MRTRSMFVTSKPMPCWESALSCLRNGTSPSWPRARAPRSARSASRRSGMPLGSGIRRHGNRRAINRRRSRPIVSPSWRRTCPGRRVTAPPMGVCYRGLMRVRPSDMNRWANWGDLGMRARTTSREVCAAWLALSEGRRLLADEKFTRDVGAPLHCEDAVAYRAIYRRRAVDLKIVTLRRASQYPLH